MRKQFYFYIGNVLLALTMVACRLAPSSGTPTQVMEISDTPRALETSRPQRTAIPSLTTAPTETQASTATPMPATNLPPIPPTLTGDLATARLVLTYFDAYNAGQLNAALALLDDRGQIGDCDFEANKPVSFRGTQEVAEWLRQRIADHDQYIVREIVGVDPTVEFSHDTVGVDFARRTSDTLQRLGYPNGTTQIADGKIILTPDHKHILGLALGPGYHSTNSCYSAFGITPATPAPAVNFPPITPTLIGNLAKARIILAFFDAYNAGQLNPALALLDDRGQIGDCDFEANKPVSFRGTQEVAEWLRQRFADKDQFIIREIGVVEGPDGGAGVEFARRTSDTLRRLGYPDGITHNVGAKIVLTREDKIDVIALGPGFHSTDSCYSAFGLTPATP